MRTRLIKVLLHLLARLPLPLIHQLGAGLGVLMYRLPKLRVTRTVHTNLALCFPHLPAEARAALARQTLRENAKTFLELGALWLWPCQKILALVRETHGEEILAAALDQGRGVILLTPHFGAWEMAGLYVSQHYAVTSLYRPLRLTALAGFVRRGRERCGARLVPTDAGGIRALYQALQRGEIAGILPDQDPGKRGLGGFAPFFGVPAYTMLLVNRLARKTGAPVLFVYAQRVADGFQIHFRAAPAEVAAGDNEQALTALNQGVAACVAQVPAQYQWGYKRFKTRPPGMGAVYE